MSEFEKIIPQVFEKNTILIKIPLRKRTEADFGMRGSFCPYSPSVLLIKPCFCDWMKRWVLCGSPERVRAGVPLICSTCADRTAVQRASGVHGAPVQFLSRFGILLGTFADEIHFLNVELIFSWA